MPEPWIAFCDIVLSAATRNFTSGTPRIRIGDRPLQRGVVFKMALFTSASEHFCRRYMRCTECPSSYVTLATDLPLRTIKCCSVVIGVTLRLLVINTSSSSPVNNKRRRLPETSVINLPRSVAAIRVLHLAVEPFTVRNEARQWLRIAILLRPSAFDAPVREVPVRTLPLP